MAGGLMFMAPDNMMTLYGTVTGGAATGYNDDHLVDGRPGRPAKAAAGSPAGALWVITGPTSKIVSHVIVANHTVPAGSAITITGGVTASLVGPAARRNGIAVNAWAAVATPASTNTITVDIDVADVIVGEVVAGLMTEMTAGILLGAPIRYRASSELPDGKASSLAGYPDNIIHREIDIEVLCESEADKDVLEGLYESTYGDTRFVVLIPFPDKNDAWLGHISKDTFSATKGTDGIWRVTFTFIECERGSY